ncbi:hypothetical protein KQX54_016985 [Cotesia glomerata]|uniref:Uncharacterized protein n=1 Tax=Cotesia glomerata TaxID=32391 RepID=A0AAV7I5V0_COTGL|nr:hypothetical protein KQX54_016985 [Cotesia glomerata]
MSGSYGGMGEDPGEPHLQKEDQRTEKHSDSDSDSSSYSDSDTVGDAGQKVGGVTLLLRSLSQVNVNRLIHHVVENHELDTKSYLMNLNGILTSEGKNPSHYRFSPLTRPGFEAYNLQMLLDDKARVPQACLNF